MVVNSMTFGRCNMTTSITTQSSAVTTTTTMITRTTTTTSSIESTTTTTPAGGCCSGCLCSPNYPLDYDNNLRNEYIIEAPAGETVTITFNTFNLESDAACEYDYIIIYEGNGTSGTPLLNKTCGAPTTMPGPVTSTSNVATLYLLTDSEETRTGFEAQLSTGVTFTARDSFDIDNEYLCDDGQCVERSLMCHGYAACDDKSDLKACTDKIKCSEDYNKTTLESSYRHTECQTKYDENNGVYDNIGRGDEKDLTRLVQSSPVNYTELQHCTDEDDPGVMCGESCWRASLWCREFSASCSTNTTQFSIKDASLCSNTTFWSNVSCNTYYNSGKVRLYGKRCFANKQHCYYPWYTRNHDFKFGGYLPTCQDKSDRIFDINTKCNISAYVDEYCGKICNETKTKKNNYCQETICKNTTEWISQQTDSFFLDPYNCESSCLNRFRGCDACTNEEDFFNCTKSGVCIHKCPHRMYPYIYNLHPGCSL